MGIARQVQRKHNVPGLCKLVWGTKQLQILEVSPDLKSTALSFLALFHRRDYTVTPGRLRIRPYPALGKRVGVVVGRDYLEMVVRIEILYRPAYTIGGRGNKECQRLSGSYYSSDIHPEILQWYEGAFTWSGKSAIRK